MQDGMDFFGQPFLYSSHTHSASYPLSICFYTLSFTHTLAHSIFFLSPALSGLDCSQRQGVEELISAVPCRFDHTALFPFLQKQTLQHRMNDSFSCLVRESERLSIIECLFICQTFLGKNIVVQASAKKGDRLPILEGE